MDKNTRRQIRVFRKKYKAPRGRVLDLGGFNVNGKIEGEHISFDIIRGGGVDVVGDAHILPFRGGSFAEVVSLSTLQYLENPFKVVAEVYRVLMLGGVAYLEAPIIETSGLIGSHWGKSAQERKGYDTFRYYPRGMEAILRQARFTDILLCQAEGQEKYCWGIARKEVV